MGSLPVPSAWEGGGGHRRASDPTTERQSWAWRQFLLSPASDLSSSGEGVRFRPSNQNDPMPSFFLRLLPVTVLFRAQADGIPPSKPNGLSPSPSPHRRPVLVSRKPLPYRLVPYAQK